MWRQLTRTDDTVAAFVLRLALGIVMFPHGAQKLLGWSPKVSLDEGLEKTVRDFRARLGMQVAGRAAH